MKKYILGLLSILLLVSCSKEEVTNPSFVEVFGVENYEQAVDQLKNYALFGVYADGIQKLLLEKMGQQDDYIGEVFLSYRPDVSQPKGDGGNYTIGNIVGKHTQNGLYTLSSPISNYSKEMGSELQSYFGSSRKFSLERDGEKIYDTSLYIPEEMEVTGMNSSGLHPFSIFNKISRNNFTFSWNSDTENSEGVLAVLTWSGDLIDTNPNNLGGSNPHMKASWLSDNGTGTIPRSFFDSVPKDAVFRIYFMRGHFDIIKGTDGRDYKIYGLTQDVKAFVLTD